MLRLQVLSGEKSHLVPSLLLFYILNIPLIHFLLLLFPPRGCGVILDPLPPSRRSRSSRDIPARTNSYHQTDCCCAASLSVWETPSPPPHPPILVLMAIEEVVIAGIIPLFKHPFLMPYGVTEHFPVGGALNQMPSERTKPEIPRDGVRLSLSRHPVALSPFEAEILS